MSDGKPSGCTRTGKSDEMLRRNVGNEQRGSDGEPSYVPAGQKIVHRSAFFTGKIESYGKDDTEVDSDNKEICFGKDLMGEMESDVHTARRSIRDSHPDCQFGIRLFRKAETLFLER